MSRLSSLLASVGEPIGGGLSTQALDIEMAFTLFILAYACTFLLSGDVRVSERRAREDFSSEFIMRLQRETSRKLVRSLVPVS